MTAREPDWVEEVRAPLETLGRWQGPPDGVDVKPAGKQFFSPKTENRLPITRGARGRACTRSVYVSQHGTVHVAIQSLLFGTFWKKQQQQTFNLQLVESRGVGPAAVAGCWL